MKWLFAYDHKFFKKEKKFYSRQGFPYDMWQRYLKHCDELIVTGRIQHLEDDESQYSLSSGNRLTFVDVPNASNLSFFMPNNESKKILIEEIKKVDGVIARIPSQIGFIAIELAKKLKKPYAIEIVGDPKESYRFHGNWKAKLYSPLATKIMKKLVKESPFSLYITEEELQKLYPTNGIQSVCSNVELTSYATKEFIENRKARVLSQKIIFGMIGSLDSDYKGLDIAIKALALINPNIPSFEFRVLGSGLSDKWQVMANYYGLSNQIIFCGTKPADKVFDWLEEIDIYLQPSRTEGQGRSVIEAMSMGCPVITSDVGGMKELAESSVRFSNANEKELAEIILNIIRNQELYCHQIDRNYNLSKKFSKDKLEKNRNKHYKKFEERILENE